MHPDPFHPSPAMPQCLATFYYQIKNKRPVPEPSMKPLVPFALFTAIGFILTAGCVATTTKNPVNESSNTTGSWMNATTTPNSTSPLQGSLVVSVAGFSYPSNISVVLDNRTVGTVNPTSSLYLKVPEGNHTIGVCADFVCEQENVTTGFGKYVTVDFSERLRKDVVILYPTARVLECLKNGYQLSVNIEFINPSKKDLRMSGVVSCGYSYVDSRTGAKLGDATRGTFVQNVKAGQRITQWMNLNLVNENSLSYSFPVIEDLKVT
jgi:hypothetical protein